MPESRFEALKLELLQGGVAPVYIARTLLELEEHYTDLEQDATSTNRSVASGPATHSSTSGRASRSTRGGSAQA